MTDEPKFTVHCPKCGSEKIRLKLIAVGSGEITEWSLRDGLPEIEDYDDPRDVEWESDGEARHQFVCGAPRCSWEGTLEDLRVGTPEPE